MSTSTIFIKRPLNYKQSLALIKEKYQEFSPFLSIILWTVTGFYAASKSDFNGNISGVSLSFPVAHLLMVCCSSLMLCKGLADRNIPLILPWIGVTIYTLYYNHYLGLMNTLETLKKVKKLSWLPWVNLIINIILLIVRGTLTIRIFQLCVHLWVRKKFKELKDKQL